MMMYLLPVSGRTVPQHRLGCGFRKPCAILLIVGALVFTISPAKADIERIVNLSGEARVEGLRELLLEDSSSASLLLGPVMFHEVELRPALRTLLADDEAGFAAARLLAYIGVPDDVQLVFEWLVSRGIDDLPNFWIRTVANALLEPQTEAAWSFLKENRVVNVLEMNGSPRSLEILWELHEQEPERGQIIRAIRNIESGRTPISDSNLVAAGEKIPRIFSSGLWGGNSEPRFNADGDKALIDCQMVWGDRSFRIFTGTFHRVEDLWKLRGLQWEISGSLARRSFRADELVGAWNGYHDEIAFARLELDENGSGGFSVLEAAWDEPATFRVTEWTVDDWRISISLEPVEPDAGPVVVTSATTNGQVIELELSGEGETEAIRLILMHEKEHDRRVERTREAIQLSPLSRGP